MNNRARMIERARRMYPKKKKLPEILARIDITALMKAITQAVEVIRKTINEQAEYLKKIAEGKNEQSDE